MLGGVVVKQFHLAEDLKELNSFLSKAVLAAWACGDGVFVVHYLVNGRWLGSQWRPYTQELSKPSWQHI